MVPAYPYSIETAAEIHRRNLLERKRPHARRHQAARVHAPNRTALPGRSQRVNDYLKLYHRLPLAARQGNVRPTDITPHLELFKRRPRAAA
jgi:hypothetical protein